MRRELAGCRRKSDHIGVRNYVVALPTSVASSYVARGIAAETGAWTRMTPHQMGTNQPNEARAQTKWALVGVGCNPNVGVALVVEFGTEDIDAADLTGRIAWDGKPVETLSVREVGGMAATPQRGRTTLDSLDEAAADTRHESTNASEFVAGVECGGGDATPGIAANPVIDDACDRLATAGGTASFSEMPELISVEHAPAERCVGEETRHRLLDRVERRETITDLIGVNLRGAQSSLSNQEGDLMTIEEKNLGTISKDGTTPVRGTVDYAKRLSVGGDLVLMDTPGYDVESVVDKVAGGTQIIVFITGHGGTTGNPITPVVKVTGSPRMWKRVRSNMNVNIGAVVEGDVTVSEVGEYVFDEMPIVADGKRTGVETCRMGELTTTEIYPRELAKVQGK